MSQKMLTVLLGGQILGRVEQNKHGKFWFVYDQIWRASSSAVPLSLSMPLAAGEHGHDAVEAFLSGLLPDNREVLDAWGRRFQVSSRNPFALLSHIGEDCAGAVQFIREERLGTVLDDQSWEVDWLDDAEIEARLGALRRDRSAWRTQQDTGQFSLAGAQPKTALLRQDGKWGIPSGRAPTTHILKPPLPDFAGHLENEHFCLLLESNFSREIASSKPREASSRLLPVSSNIKYQEGLKSGQPGCSIGRASNTRIARFSNHRTQGDLQWRSSVFHPRRPSNFSMPAQTTSIWTCGPSRSLTPDTSPAPRTYPSWNPGPPE